MLSSAVGCSAAYFQRGASITEICREGSPINSGCTCHWSLRYLHVACFPLFFSTAIERCVKTSRDKQQRLSLGQDSPDFIALSASPHSISVKRTNTFKYLHLHPPG